MDLTQRKLTKSEWEYMERPVNDKEKMILQLIRDGYHDVQILRNNTLSLLDYLKIAPDEILYQYVYTKYIAPILEPILKKYDIPYNKPKKSKKCKIKKANLIRLENTDTHLDEQQDNLFEFIIISFLKIMLSNKKKQIHKWMRQYYTLNVLLTYHISNTNPILISHVKTIMNSFAEELSFKYMLEQSVELIEKNDALLKYADIKLYDHQKELFTICKNNSNPKLILLIAPTGTGKTLSPLGLSEQYKIIFVCAARHVGLALARSAISLDKKVAFAFGCNDATDIRLHYFAAKDYTRHRRTGGIFRVDNSVGDNVEIMISDIKSYISAMRYMLAFNPKEKIILYWDEPTISLDELDHPCHSMIQENWTQNVIPTVILSSATLPNDQEIVHTLADFRSRFTNARTHTITSQDCVKTIPLINKEGFAELPHYMYDDYDLLKTTVDHCLTHTVLLRYLDLGEIIKFIIYIDKNKYYKGNRYALNRSFPTIDTITMQNIKIYYLELLRNIKSTEWDTIYNTCNKNRTRIYDSTINMTTSDAVTLTVGPTIFIADNVENIAQVCIQTAQIPIQVTSDIMNIINENNTINNKITELEKEFEAGVAKTGESSVNPKDTSSRSKRLQKQKKESDHVPPEMRKIMETIQDLRRTIRSASLNTIFVPNSVDHLYKWANNKNILEANKPFTCDISEDIVEEIMTITGVEDSWKLLLMMGIGVFVTHTSTKYVEIMKKLAEEQKLYMIIAGSDYIYGTNYQFCHGYIGKDLETMSQEKCIQALGRIGRNNLQQQYSLRFRSNNIIQKLFTPLSKEEKPEAVNMNKLFNT